MRDAELLFWNMILKKDKTGYRFNRQKPIGPYILDFYCHKLKLGIEIDDKSHDFRYSEDNQRTEFLTGRGILVVRYSNELVTTRLEGIYYDLMERIQSRVKELGLQQ